MNIIQFLKDYSIPYDTEGKNVSPGWANIKCPNPYCNDHSNHGGFNIEYSYYNCWKCGKHPIPKIISILLKINEKEAKKIIKSYKTIKNKKENKTERIKPKTIKLPDCTELQERHRNYLIKRNFDPDKLIKKFNLKGTDHNGNFKLRIIAPIYLDNKLISYQGRDITDLSNLKYKMCPKELEIIPNKHILYNIDNIINRKAIIVEGITDVWRLGDGAVATFGTGFMQEQIKFIKERLNEVYILFDNDNDIVIESSERLYSILKSIGINVEMIELDEGDPGDMSDEDAKYLKKELLGY